MLAHTVELALRRRFAAPQYAFITGVRNDAGFKACRTCDALAIGTWPSTGLDLEGIEIKVARGDWLREIQDPSKGDAFAKHCDYWWIATPPGIVKLPELPATWGLIEVVGDHTKIRRPSTRNAAPAAVTRGLLAAIARRVHEQAPSEALLKEAVRQALHEERKTRVPILTTSYESRNNAERVAALNAFEEGAGRYIGHDIESARQLGTRVKAFLLKERELQNAKDELKRLAARARIIANELADDVMEERPTKE